MEPGNDNDRLLIEHLPDTTKGEEPMNEQSTFKQLVPIFAQTGVALVILLLMWLIISNLPMLESINLPLPFNLTEFLSAVLMTIIVVLLINLGSRLQLRLLYIKPRFKNVQAIVRLLMSLIAVFLLYNAYRPILIPYLGNYEWAYHVFFLFWFIALLGFLGYSIYLLVCRQF